MDGANEVDVAWLFLVFGICFGGACGWYTRIVWVGVVNIFVEITAFFRRSVAQ